MGLISCTSLLAALLCWSVVPETHGKGLADGDGDGGDGGGGSTGTRSGGGHAGASTRVSSAEVGAASPEQRAAGGSPPMC